MKIVYIHGINTTESAAEAEEEWDNSLFGESQPDGGTEMLYWGDLSVQMSKCRREFTLVDNLLCELLNVATANDLLKDVHNYFYRVGMRDSILSRYRQMVKDVKEPITIIGHSWGTAIAYDALSCFGTQCAQLITLGSPLGLRAVQAELRCCTKQTELAVPEGVRSWINYSDLMDFVAMQHFISPFYKPNTSGVGVTDDIVDNPMAPKDPHSIDGYFQVSCVETDVFKMLSR